jgi:hypothetical protein
MMAFSQTGSPADTLACVEVKSTPVTVRGRSMVEVELTNHCSDDITAYKVGLSDGYGSEPVQVAVREDLLNLLCWKLLGQKLGPPTPYRPNDIFRRGQSTRLQLAVPTSSPKYLSQPSVTAIVFLGRTAVGDGEAVRNILDDRKAYLEGLVSIQRQLAAVGDLAKDKERFRNHVRSTKDLRERAAMSSNERLAKDWMDDAERYSEIAPTNESWQVYIAGKAKELDRQIEIYKEHSTLDGAK